LKVEQVLKIFARRRFRGSDVCIGSIVCDFVCDFVCILGRQSGDGQQQAKRDPHKAHCNRGLKERMT
jgi:hypothetical protein